MPRYVVAVLRDAVARVPRDWGERLVGFPGVRVVGDIGGRRTVIEVEDEALDALRVGLGPDFRVEREIEHRER